MSRLIDADVLIENRFKNDISYNAFVNLVKRQTTVDAVPVVRCKDCKFFREHLSMNCVYHISAVGENWFCSQGRVKE